MQNQVIADIEIEGQKIEYYSSVIIRQQFNAHHEFTIRMKYDVLETQDAFSLKETQKFIGKSVIIKLTSADSSDAAYEFRGIICEVMMEQSENFTKDLVLSGYSPTILLENGPNLNSFNQKNLQQIVQQLTSNLGQNCGVNCKPSYQQQLTYICQYKESNFHFLNRLSSHYGEWFYYDGSDLNFGKPANSPNVEITYGEDASQIQFRLRAIPTAFSSYSYISKDDKFVTYDAPVSINGLDTYADKTLKQSNQMFSDAVQFPVKQRVQDKSDLETFVKQQKAAMAADLEVLSGSSDNPSLCLGAIASVKYSVQDKQSYKTEEHGKYLVTSIEHYISANSRYYNMFEAIPSNLDIIPVKNIIEPLAEPQAAMVKDNNDPDKTGRVRVQMLWQQKDDLMTDWLRVMTPDAGKGKDGAKNRGLVAIPEVDDQVLICFRYNDPDRPFVMGSLFNGKTSEGGGDNNKVKSITTLSGSEIKFDGDAISIIDATTNNKILFDGKGKIDIISTDSLTLTCGDSSITMKKDGSIEIKGGDIKVSGKTITTNGSSKAVMQSGGATFTASGGEASMEGSKASMSGQTEAKVSSSASTSISAGAKVEVKGAIITLN